MRRAVVYVVAALVVLIVMPSTAVAVSLPGAPGNVRGIYTDNQGERVTVGWDPPPDAIEVTAYQVQASRDGIRWSNSRISECDPPSPEQTCSPELTVVFSYELTSYETYVFRAAAYNAAGWGPWSELSPPFTVLPGNRPRVGAPEDVVAVPMLEGMRVAWSPPRNATDAYYLVEWSRDGRPWQGADTTRALTYTFTDLAYGSYSVRVRSQRYEVEYSTWSLAGPITVPDRRQRIVGYAGLPDDVIAPGRTVIVPCDLSTNAGQRVRVGIRWELRTRTARGSLDPVTVHRSKCGRVAITLSGVPVKVWVTLAAPAKGRYAELLRTKTYRAP